MLFTNFKYITPLCSHRSHVVFYVSNKCLWIRITSSRSLTTSTLIAENYKLQLPPKKERRTSFALHSLSLTLSVSSPLDSSFDSLFSTKPPTHMKERRALDVVIIV
jgi:hypothetical protein